MFCDWYHVLFYLFLCFALFKKNHTPGCLKKTEFCKIKHLQIVLVIGEEYLWFFLTNPVEPVKSGVVGLIPVRITSRNHLFCAVSAKCPIKALKLLTQSMLRLNLQQKNHKYFSPITSRICNAQFGKTQFFFETPCTIWKNHTMNKLPFSRFSSTRWTMRRGSRLSWQDFWSL